LPPLMGTRRMRPAPLPALLAKLRRLAKIQRLSPADKTGGVTPASPKACVCFALMTKRIFERFCSSR
jgi:hypothetical protein